MAWHLNGRGMEVCSCKSFCPCWLGPSGEPDQGWCSAVFGYQIDEGRCGKVDLAGTRVAMAADWPGNFFGGQGVARVYLDDGASEEQRRALDAIIGGKLGGFIGDLWDAVIDNWLPTQSAKISLTWDDKPSVAVDGIGATTMTRLTDGAGKATMVSGAVAQAAMHIETMNLAHIESSQWSDSGLRGWRAEDAVLYDINWSS